MPPGSISGIVLGTQNLAATATELRARGLTTLSEIESQPWGAFATFTDPDGNGFVLQQAAPGV
jgi:predicted enzyme related to lactoylglutathione lyase